MGGFDPGAVGNPVVIPVGNDATQTTTSTTFVGMDGSTWLAHAEQLGSGSLKARLWVRAQNTDTADSIYYRVNDGVDETELAASETVINPDSSGTWYNEFGPEFPILEDPAVAAKDYSIRWKVDGGTGETSGGAGVAVLLYR